MFSFKHIATFKIIYSAGTWQTDSKNLGIAVNNTDSFLRLYKKKTKIEVNVGREISSQFKTEKINLIH